VEGGGLADDDAVRPEWVPAELELKPISGGVLAQRIDADGDHPANWTHARHR
jgi:hypothetical protein